MRAVPEDEVEDVEDAALKTGGAIGGIASAESLRADGGVPPAAQDGRPWVSHSCKLAGTTDTSALLPRRLLPCGRARRGRSRRWSCRTVGDMGLLTLVIVTALSDAEASVGVEQDVHG